MIGKSSIFFLAATFLFLVNIQTTYSQTTALAADKQIRAKVEKLGAGAKVTVVMKDGTKIRGSISQILDDSFDVTLAKETQSSIISYRDVQSVKRRGWSSSAKVIVGVLAGGGAVIAVLALIIGNTAQ